MSRIEQSLEKATAKRKDREDIYVRQNALNTGFVSKITEIKTDNPYLATYQEPESVVSEEYKILKSVVKRMTSQDGFNNVIMVTSSNGNEGKSLTALNLAISLSQEYDTTALIMEADLRKPSLSGYLNLNVEQGWTDYLTENVDLHSVMIRTDISNLKYLPPGNGITDPVEFFSSTRLGDLIKELKHRYNDRYVIIDAPPVLPFAETRQIGSLADAVIFVVGEKSSSLKEIEESLDILRDANVLGIVYNKSNTKRARGYSRYYSSGNDGINSKQE